MSKSLKTSNLLFDHTFTLGLQQTLSQIGKAFFKSAVAIRKCAAKEMHNRKNQPHSFDAPLLPKLAFIKGKFLLAVSEKHLNAPAFCIHFEDFLYGKVRLRRDEHSQCIRISEGLFRIAQQNNRFFAVAHFALIPIRIEAPMANGHEADIRIIFADGRSKCFCLLSDLVEVDDAVGAQRANGLEPLLRKSSHQFIRCVPAVAEEIRSIRRHRQFLSNAPDNLNLGTRLVIQHHRVVQRESIARQHHANRLMPIIVALFQVRHVVVRRFDGVQRL